MKMKDPLLHQGGTKTDFVLWAREGKTGVEAPNPGRPSATVPYGEGV